MYNYIYELLQAPAPSDEWSTEWDLAERPDAFPIATRIGHVDNRDDVIAHFGAWLEEHRLGTCANGVLSLNAGAADRYFEGRFASFQKAVAALQQLNEMQFIHEHDHVQGLINDLCETFTQKYGDYVLLDNGQTLVPLEEFLRTARPGEFYYLGSVLNYKY